MAIKAEMAVDLNNFFIFIPNIDKSGFNFKNKNALFAFSLAVFTIGQG